MRESFISSREDERIDNYDVVCDNWRKLYQAMDKEELRERFHLERDEQALYLTFYNEKYRLDHKSGMLTLVHDPDRKLLFSTVISIYNLFHYAKPGARLAGELPGVRLRGLMAIPPISQNPGDNREYFSKLRQLFVDIKGKILDNQTKIDCLSMGMSGDYADAIAEGATLVRVGTALFGPRPPIRAFS